LLLRTVTMNTTLWGTSPAKSILHDEILAGTVKEGDDMKVIHQSNPEYFKCHSRISR
jgi:hypothetical protein